MSRRKNPVLAVVAVVLALVLAGTVWVLVAHDYGLHEERVTIEGPRGELTALLAKPAKHEGPSGLVIVVHDAGPVNATDDDADKPVWAAYAKSGFAVLAWDKPGVDGAPGDWRSQSMHDRAGEVEAAISWAYTRPDLDTTRIGLWGVGEAGLVMPEVLASRSDIRFAVAVGPAVDGSSLRRAENRGGDVNAAAVLRSVTSPLLLVIGGKDRDIDVDVTEAVYRKSVRPDLLTVKRFDDATHMVTRNDIEYRDDAAVAARRMLAPSTVYAPGYLDALRVFATRHTR